jgi:outer membrane protein
MKHSGKTMRRCCGFCLVLYLIGFWPYGAQPADTQSPIPQPAVPMTDSKAATSGQTLTLDDAILIGLENHPSLKAARERIGAQRAVLGQQMAAYYPSIVFTDRYQTGDQSGSTNVAESASEFYSAQLSANMTLYNFGKREGAVEAARQTLNAVGYNYKTTADSVILGVKQSYYVYLQARAIVKVREETVNSRDLLVRQARGFFEVGTRARIDVARAESNLYLAQADLIAAQNAVKVAWVVFRNALGLRELSERPLAEEAAMTSIPYSLDEAKEFAFATRPELKSFDAQLKAQDQNIATARRSHLPDLIFDGNFARRHVSNQVVNGHTLDTFPLKPSWQAQLTLAFPIFDGFRTTNKVEETVRNFYVIKDQEEQQRQQVALDVEQSYLRLVELQERIKANEAAAKAAKENLDLANGRYQVGVGSIIEVTDAQILYTDAQTTYIRALYDYKIADAQLARAMGK